VLVVEGKALGVGAGGEQEPVARISPAIFDR
jgi:hypothetical protein